MPQRRVFLPWAIVLLSPLAGAQARVDCNALHSRILKRVVHYCVDVPPGYDNPDPKHSARRYPVLYFLHGLGQNEQTLFNTGGMGLLDDLRQQHKIGDFLIVAPEGWNSFYVNSADGTVRYSDFFLQEFMPYIEGKYRVRRGRGGRGISGVSMGGYGALRLAFAHPEMFSSVSAQSAALMTDSPQQLDAAAHSHAPMTGLLSAVFGQPIDVPHWLANNPFILAKQHEAGLRKLAIYFNCGEQDDFGFEKGAETLHRQLQAQGIRHEYHLYPGDHSLTYFVAHIGETMEFHSKAFAGAKN
jgi:S-formylglutathione hydrolase FrmB